MGVLVPICAQALTCLSRALLPVRICPLLCKHLPSCSSRLALRDHHVSSYALQSPASASTIDIANQAPQPASIQVRVFRWMQAGGHETLTPTEDVVASPPFATIASGTTLSVRVIRASKAPIVGEEAYRVVVDQLPETNRNGRVMVAMLLRQVLPAFFGGADKSSPDVSWTIRRVGAGLALFAHNNGDRRLRVAHVVLADSSHRSITLSGGLLGYVLGHSDMS